MQRLNTLSKAFCRVTLLRLQRWYPPAIALVLWVLFFKPVGDSIEEPEIVETCQEVSRPHSPKPELLKTYPKLIPKIRKLAKAEAKVMGYQVEKTARKKMIAFREGYRSRQTPMERELDVWRERQRRKWVHEREHERKNHKRELSGRIYYILP